jgi:hypothetical protein
MLLGALAVAGFASAHGAMSLFAHSPIKNVEGNIGMSAAFIFAGGENHYHNEIIAVLQVKRDGTWQNVKTINGYSSSTNAVDTVGEKVCDGPGGLTRDWRLKATGTAFDQNLNVAHGPNTKFSSVKTITSRCG